MDVEIWSDFACPWCALGLARLDAALRDFEHAREVRVVHRSYELHPGAPARSGRTAQEAVAAKYGMSAEQVRAGHARLAELGGEAGLVFDFDRVQLANTFDAHRLAQAARGEPYEGALVRRLFSAYFAEGRLLSDPAVLRDVAHAAGLDEHITEKVLSGDAYAREVRADEAAATDLGVAGVPYFLLNGAWPVPGAQDVETMGVVLRRAWSRLGH
ncbi:MAG TPA: DsbA family oxidoreductase [Acidimicrobiales bacterium]|nr:DsbA family oxidoreductase [Acidimicrobiales bacterium]